MISSSLFWRISIRLSRLSKQPRTAPIPKHARRELPSAGLGYAAQELKPLWHRLRELLLASPKLCVDETPAPVLDPGRGRTKTGYFWALSRDDRPWAGPDPPGVV
ncbi:hypothetical protein ABIB75_007730, partial [Bradyrhizobium sp. GM2.2]